MKDEVFLRKMTEDRAALIAELREKKKWQQGADWVALAALTVNMILAVFSDRRWIDYGPLLEGVMLAIFAATTLYYDVLIKTLKISEPR